MKFNERFKQLKEKSDLSLSDLAVMSGLKNTQATRQYFSNITRNLSYPSKQGLKNICKEAGWNYKELRDMIVIEQCQKIMKKWK